MSKAMAEVMAEIFRKLARDAMRAGDVGAAWHYTRRAERLEQ